MPIRENDPRKLEDWMVRVERRLRELESRRLDAMEGLEQDHATKQIRAKLSGDGGNAAAIGSDGGIYAPTAPEWTTVDHAPLYIQAYMTAGQNILNATETTISWSAAVTSGTWQTTATSITIPEDGYYCVSLMWDWANNTTGTRTVHIWTSPGSATTTGVFANSMEAVNDENNQNLIGFKDFTAGTVLVASCWQNSTVTLSAGFPYYGDIRGRWTIFKLFDAIPPALQQVQ